jgi:hypothetical protein
MMSQTNTQTPATLTTTTNPSSGNPTGGGGGGGGQVAGGQAAGGGGPKLLGTEPTHFAGDRRDVDRFMADLVTYIDLNSQNASLASYKTKVHFALSFMSGEVIRHWKVCMLDWVRPNNVIDEEATWDQFLVQFRAEYADTQ